MKPLDEEDKHGSVNGNVLESTATENREMRERDDNDFSKKNEPTKTCCSDAPNSVIDYEMPTNSDNDVSMENITIIKILSKYPLLRK